MSSFAEIEMEVVRLAEQINMHKLDKNLLLANLLQDTSDLLRLQIMNREDGYPKLCYKIGDIAIDLIVYCMAHDINLTDNIYRAHNRNLETIASQVGK